MMRACHSLLLSVLLAVMIGLTASCTKDDVILAESAPQIILSNDTGAYTVKAGRTLTLSPLFKGLNGGDVEWIMDGEIIARGPELEFLTDTPGTYYVTVRATNASGVSREDMRIDVVRLLPPAIVLTIPEEGLFLQAGHSLTLAPRVVNDDLRDYTIGWSVDGRVVSDTNQFTFSSSVPGVYRVQVEASNEDGTSSRSFDITVTPDAPCRVSFPGASYRFSATTRYTFPGRPVYLTPYVDGILNPGYVWSVEGLQQDCDDDTFIFTPSAPGVYTVEVSVSSRASASVEVVCVDATEASRYRAPSGAGPHKATHVYEYTPAPGQFINDPISQASVSTPDEACTLALKSLNDGSALSLGALGGTLIAGFGHSVPLSGADYDLEIGGNQFDSTQGASSEPGIVWVMQDVNGNGLPDDEWYQLRGSDYDAPSTIHNLYVTYYRPGGDCMDVDWTDSRAGSGSVSYNGGFHSQPSYFPAWIEGTSYTLHTSRLAPRNSYDPSTGFWTNAPYAWGYADNVGSDLLPSSTSSGGTSTGLRIANAVFPDGTPVGLTYIDFIMIQSAVQAQSGTLGELSTEITLLRHP